MHINRNKNKKLFAFNAKAKLSFYMFLHNKSNAMLLNSKVGIIILMLMVLSLKNFNNSFAQEVLNLSYTGSVSKFCADLLRFFMAASSEVAGGGVSIHDPCAVAWLIDPTLFKAAEMHVTVELRGECTRGMTVCDYRHLRGSDPNIDLSRIPTNTLRGKPSNCEAALELDVERFLKLIRDTIVMYA